MKHCEKCGAEMDDNANVCPNCGNQNMAVQNTASQTKSNNSGLKTAIKIFMIIGCIASAISFFIPLCWTIPMTVTYFNKVERGEPVSVGFKVCTLLFVNLISGILMLFDNN